MSGTRRLASFQCQYQFVEGIFDSASCRHSTLLSAQEFMELRHGNEAVERSMASKEL